MTRSRDDRDGVVRESADASFWNPVVHTNMFRVLSVRSLAVRLSSVCELNSCIYSPSPHRATRWEEIVCGLRSKARQDRGAVCNHLRIILLNTHVCMRLVKLLYKCSNCAGELSAGTTEPEQYSEDVIVRHLRRTI